MDFVQVLVWMAFVITAFMVGRSQGFHDALDQMGNVMREVIMVKRAEAVAGDDDCDDECN